MQKQNEEKFKKRISLGAHLVSTHTHSSRIIYNSVKNSTTEFQASKQKAVHWFRKWSAFKRINPEKTYAQALRKNSDKKFVTVNEGYKAKSASIVKKYDSNVKQKISSPIQDSVNSSSCKIKYLGEKTRVLHNTKNVPVPLHNRFQVLADHSDQYNASVEDDKPRGTSTGCSMDYLQSLEAGKRSFQHSQECKHPSTLGVILPLLAEQKNCLLLGNKNGTGCFMGDLNYTESPSAGPLCKVSSDSGGRIQSSDNVLDCEVNSCQQEHNSDKLEANIGTNLQPQLADPKISFLGNKNGTGYFNGVLESANSIAKNNYEHISENCSDDSHIMGTALQYQMLDGNYSLNSNAVSQQPQVHSQDTD